MAGECQAEESDEKDGRANFPVSPEF